MKRFAFFPFSILLFTMISGFSSHGGGDILRIYLNGRQVHQQFVQVDKSAKLLHLSSLRHNDKVEVFYSHCGQAGKSRVLTFKNEKGETVKTLPFADAGDKETTLPFYGKDIPALKGGTLRLYYSSKDLSQARLIATISHQDVKTATASL